MQQERRISIKGNDKIAETQIESGSHVDSRILSEGYKDLCLNGSEWNMYLYISEIFSSAIRMRFLIHGI